MTAEQTYNFQKKAKVKDRVTTHVRYGTTVRAIRVPASTSRSDRFGLAFRNWAAEQVLLESPVPDWPQTPRSDSGLVPSEHARRRSSDSYTSYNSRIRNES